MSRFPVDELADHLGPLSKLCVESWVETERPDSIVLCDFHSCFRYFETRGVDLEFVRHLGPPVIAMDIWDGFETNTQMDLVGGDFTLRAGRVEQFTGRLVPVPMGKPSAAGGYCSLSGAGELPRVIRHRVRQDLGIAEGDRTVLFCTAGWQHDMKHPARRRLADALPGLLANYLSRAVPGAYFIHVGPTPLNLARHWERYRWIPPVSPDEFAQVLGSVDLFLSANISATTVGRAVAGDVPVLVVQNSCRAETIDEAEAVTGKRLSPWLREWVESVLPLYPFVVWPLGYAEFLKPLLCDNPFCRALNVVELLDEQRYVETLRQLLFDAEARRAAIERQMEYSAEVRKIPTAAEVIDRHLN
jgi:hypothetical protein